MIEFSVGLTEVEFVGSLGVGVTYGVPCELGGQVAGAWFRPHLCTCRARQCDVFGVGCASSAAHAAGHLVYMYVGVC